MAICKGTWHDGHSPHQRKRGNGRVPCSREAVIGDKFCQKHLDLYAQVEEDDRKYKEARRRDELIAVIWKMPLNRLEEFVRKGH